MRYPAAALTVLLSGILLTGCSLLPEGNGSNSEDNGGSAADMLVEDPLQDDPLAQRLHLPIYDYQLTSEQHDVLENARIMLLEDCMERLGYDYTHGSGGPEDMSVYREFFGPYDEYRRYGITSRHTAETYAYNVPSEIENENLVPASFGHTGATLQDAEAARDGTRTDISTPSGEPVPEGGCAFWADSQLTGATSEEDDVPVSYDLTVQGIQRESFDESLADTRVTGAIGEWSSCLAEEGYDLEHPLDIDSEYLGVGEAEQAHVDMAIADLDCKEEVGLIDTWLSVETEIQERLIAENETVISESRERLDSSVEQAVEVLGE